MQQPESASGEISVGIVGAGIIALSAAWELQQRGASIAIYQQERPVPASLVSAGMIGAAFELGTHFDTHPQLAELCLWSAGLWPEYARKLEQDSGIDPGLDSTGTIACTGEMSGQALELIANYCALHDIPCQALSGDGLQQLEPLLARVEASLFLPDDIQVDPPALLAALRRVIAAGGAVFHNIHKTELGTHADGRLGLIGHDRHDAMLWAVGAAARWPLRIDGQDVELIPPGAVFPVKGEIAILSRDIAVPGHVIRSGQVYIVPKRDRILVGATSHSGRDDTDIDPGAIASLLDRARGLYPALGKAELVSQRAGIRPGSADHAPLMGWSAVDKLYCATGHFRNGILLAPASSRLIADAVTGQKNRSIAQFFDIGRESVLNF